MAPLTNIRREAFANLFARGVPRAEAYRVAGFAGHPSSQNLYHLLQEPDIKARVAEIVAKAAAKNEVTVARVLKELATLAYAKLGDERVPASVKRQALVDLGKYLRMFEPDFNVNALVVNQQGGGAQDAASLERIMMSLIDERRRREQMTIEHQSPEIHVVGERKAEDGPRLVENHPPKPPGFG